MIKKNFVKEKLQQGKAVLGTWAIVPSAVTTDIIASTGLDFVIIDSEHGPISFETAQTMAMVCESHGVSPIMRVGDIDEADILKSLDIGMHGIQIPNIQTPEDVKRVISYAKYPPCGKRGFSPFTRAGGYSLEKSQQLTEIANEQTLVAINIEGTEAIEKIDEILEIPELDILFIGLYDLSKSLGIPGQVEHSEVIRLLVELTQKINNADKIAGTITIKHENIPFFLERGLRYIVHLVDCEMFRSAYKSVKKTFDESCHGLCLHH